MLDLSFETKINRADELAAKDDAARELLAFYCGLLRLQKKIYDDLQNREDWLPSGSLEEDLPSIRGLFIDFLKATEKIGTPRLVEESRLLSKLADADLDQLLLAQWYDPATSHFFAKAFLQPYGRLLAESGLRSVLHDVHGHGQESRCPVCAGPPQVSCLLMNQSVADSGGRYLICSACLTVWPFRRVVCANCGEERPANLAYFQSSQCDYVRIEACESCRHYIKGVDLTRFGLADPIVDEVAAAPLDLWARDQGYQKIELNLVGL
jgi:FdhE protein